jgi:ankyrin repeat protein
MEAKFHPAIAAIRAGDIESLKSLIREDPTLATGRSSISHPTLLQCLVLDAVDVPNKLEMAKILIDAGADIDGPLVACASIDNVQVAELLLDSGAAIDGAGGWSPLEEALYWGNDRVKDLLLARSARVQNLRSAAGLGRMDLIQSFFNRDGTLRADAGKIDWPFGKLQKSKLNCQVNQELLAKADQWSNEPRDIINNAFVYACMGNHIEAAKFLLAKGAEINVIPQGFDYAGTGLHYAALRGHRAMVDFLLEQGADKSIKDTKVGSPPSSWADYGGHAELRDYLKGK